MSVGMTKEKVKTGTEGSRRVLSPKSASTKSVQRKSPDLAEVRQQITDLVGSGAVGMVEATMEEVGKGHYLGMKFLFEMIGLYPATSTDDAPVQDSLAATLLRRLGLAEESILESGVTKGSTTTATASKDVLE
jgi:hypothetical protein